MSGQMAPTGGGEARHFLVGGLAIAGLLGCGLFITIGLFSPGLVLPQIAREFATTSHAELLTEMIGAVASFSFALGAPCAGALIARYGCRTVIVPALILFALFGTLPAVLDNLWLIVASRAALGFALSGVFTGSLTGIGALSEAQRVRLFGWFSVVAGAAAILLFPIVGMLGHINWRLAFLVHLAALLIVPLAFAIPAALGRIEIHAASAPGGGRILTVPMLGLLAIAGLSGMSMMISPVYGPLYLASLGITDTRISAIPLTLGSIAAVIASANYGPLHRRLGLAGVSILTTAFMGGALLLAGTARNIETFSLAITIQSALLALLAPNVNASAIAFSPPHRSGQAIGLANGVFYGSQLLFPFVAAWLRGAAGISMIFYGFGLALLAVSIVALVRHLASRRAPPAMASSVGRR